MSTDFKKYIKEIQSLDIRVKDNRLTLEHKSNSENANYKSELINLQQDAISELLEKSPQQIKQHLARLKRLKRILNSGVQNSIKAYHKFEEGALTESEFERMFSAFNISKHEHGNISSLFLHELHEALMYKRGALNGFEEQVADTVQEVKKLSGNNERTVDEKIEQWVAENLPSAPDKKGYEEIFRIIHELDNPKKVTVTNLLGKIHKKIENPVVGDSRLRQVIPTFTRDLPL